MKKIWFSVSYSNAFLFRTDPEQDSYRADWTESELVQRFPTTEGFKVIRNEAPTGYTQRVVSK